MQSAMTAYPSWVSLLVLISLFSPCGFAQTTSTEILGLVTDATGAVVPGAPVSVTRVATGETRTAVTNQAGEYTFPLIEIGEYRVRVEAAGFRSQSVTGLRIELQQKARVNFVLEVGQVTETDEVAAMAMPLRLSGPA